MKNLTVFHALAFPALLLSLSLAIGSGPASAQSGPVRIGYSFNEGTQAGTDGMVTDYYGVLPGAWAGTWAGDLYFRPGLSGEEGDFSITSAGNRVRVDANSAFGTQWGSFTAEAHFTMGPTGPFRRILGWGISGGYRPILDKTSANELRTPLVAEGDLRTPPLEEGRWYHAAVVYNVEAGTTSFYLDGALVDSGSLSAWEIPDDLFIAATHTGGGAWNGNIDNVRITAAALSPDEFLTAGFGSDLTEPSLGFEQWRQANFDANEMNDSEISGPAATPSGDGIPNLLKFALGIPDPKTPARERLPMAEVVDGELELTYPRAREATDVELIVEVSSDLVEWNSGQGYTEVISIDDSQDPERVTVRTVGQSQGAGQLFIRLVAIQMVE